MQNSICTRGRVLKSDRSHKKTGRWSFQTTCRTYLCWHFHIFAILQYTLALFCVELFVFQLFFNRFLILCAKSGCSKQCIQFCDYGFWIIYVANFFPSNGACTFFSKPNIFLLITIYNSYIVF